MEKKMMRPGMHLKTALILLSFFGIMLISSAHAKEQPSSHVRKLLDICTGPDTQTHYFEVTLHIVPDEQSEICSVADQVLLGNDLNQLLLNHGIGEAGADDDIIYHAGVCTQPTTSTQGRSLVSVGAFIYVGGGGCRFCLQDNNDQRHLLRGIGQRSSRELQTNDPAWFAETFAPQTEATLEDAILLEIAPFHQSCLGVAPTVDVIINEVTMKDLNLACEDGTVIESLQSLKLDNVNLRKETCSKCSSLDFSKAGNGKKLNKGDYVRDDWKTEDGVTISASGGYTPNFKARIFDTGDAVCVNVDGSRDFGSPNKNCAGGGIGEGNGGVTGSSGENCKPIGNVLIVQESDKACPDANSQGGILKFAWDEPVMLSDIGLMDVDEEGQRLRITYADGFVETFTYEGFGDNAVQRVIANKLNVVQLEVIFPGSGAVTEINFCPECLVDITGHDIDHHCLSTDGDVLITPEEVVAYDTFETSTSMIGWVNGRLETKEEQNFSKFLGRFSLGMASPYKTFSVPRDAISVTFDLDFYEVDSWDLNEDRIDIYIDGEEIAIGNFIWWDDEGHRQGITNRGITWTLDSLNAPDFLGFNPQFKDQKHRISFTIPEMSGLYSDGQLRLTIKTTVTTDVTDESSGWDNIKVTVRHGCQTQHDALSSPGSNSAPKSPTPAPLPQCDLISSKQLLLETFEGGQAIDSLSGWTNGKIAAGATATFTKFLGRYGAGDLSPEKTFSVPKPTDAAVLIFEVDFYEIDSWDGSYQTGKPDTASIYVGGERIDLGIFLFWIDEGHRFGTTQSGMFWQLSSLGGPADLGFNRDGNSLDQKHHISIEIPSWSGKFDNGKLNVKFVANVSSPNSDESAGWDNVKISSKSGCTF